MSQSTQDRRWEVNLEPDDFGGVDLRQFEADLLRAMERSGGTLLDIGGALQVYVIRQQDPESELWYPVKAVFKWQSFVPGVRAPRPQPEPTVEVSHEPDGLEDALPAQPEPEEEFEDLTGAGYVDDGEGQWFVRGDERVLATSAKHQQQLLREGFEPEPGE